MNAQSPEPISSFLPPLLPGDVHLFFAIPELAGAVDEHGLSLAEQARLARLHFEVDRRSVRAAYGLKHVVLNRALGQMGAGWTEVTGPHGKPALAEPWASGSGVRYNLSHSRRMVMMGVARDVELGVDLEDVDRVRAHDDVAAQCFAPNECADLAASGSATRFVDYWTLKEAYLKARGEGLLLPLAQVMFAFHGQRIHFGAPPALEPTPGAWQFALLAPIPECRAAVAIARGSRPALTVRAWLVGPGNHVVALTAAHYLLAS
ncbi:MAG: 4'-phosphopantetheinyl transferase family protein [Kiritimatiellia bacterium]